ncbi:hypothetical protein [Planktothrix phage Pra-JY27]|nr:hypothetical protein [Planktothrix phage Pag-Yong1]WEV89274.1 hypothetical protein [Synechococcus phage MinM2]
MSRNPYTVLADDARRLSIAQIVVPEVSLTAARLAERLAIAEAALHEIKTEVAAFTREHLIAERDGRRCYLPELVEAARHHASGSV